jgi:diguanylate cyclase (GGDEF)-like protein
MQSIANVLANAIERHAAEEHTRHEALHDPLTGLPNRNLFLDRLAHALTQSERRQTSVAVLFCDLDQFKVVNDSLGHAAGDELLAAVALRFEQTLRPEDTIARFGGDEFAVLVEDVSSERGATRVAERLAASLARPFILRRQEHFVSASVGISIGAVGEKPEALMRDADAALYRAKERGRGRYEIFDEVLRARVVDNMQTENALRRALERGELELHYQPVISLRGGTVAGLEALMRWSHPDRGLLYPGSFMSAAEDSQLILPMGRWAMNDALRTAAAWQGLDPDGPPTRIAVNLSARQLTDPQLPADLEKAIHASGIEPVTVELEITETALLEETESPERSVQGLKEMGVRVVLDDFGTGFSSLGYLRRFPLDAIKLDRAFVEHLADRSEDEAIVRAVVEMAGALGLDVVAEGVETADQLEAVAELGCSHAQGFYFAHPTPPEQVPDLLADPPWAPVRLAGG